jgi:hypothetical protein
MKKNKKHGSVDLVYRTFLGHLYIYIYIYIYIYRERERERERERYHMLIVIINCGGWKVRQPSFKRCKKLF